MIKERKGYLHSVYDASNRAFASKMKKPFLKVDATDQLRFARKNYAPSRVEVVYLYLSYGDVEAGSYVMNSAVKAVSQTAEGPYVTDSMGSIDWSLFKIHFFSAPERKERLTGPIQFINKLLGTWQLEPKDAVPLLGHEPSEMPYVSDLLNGRTALKGRDTKDRIVYLFHIRKTLSALFPSEEDENKWLRKPHAALEGQTPMQRLLEGSMENLLLVKEFVEEAAGR
ncbi:MAG: DUF2384 domain-containing protein [Chloroflexi bacterium]|nr:DUF2384 domain-containing protein [Chloroflexota bacterium]